jgi:hypothetical protein
VDLDQPLVLLADVVLQRKQTAAEQNSHVRTSSHLLALSEPSC